MKKYGLIFIMSLLACVTMKAQECERYIEVTGTSEMEVVPDEIHYLIEIQEYFEEEFDGVSKPEQYKTKVPITRIEQELMQAIHDAGIPDSAVRVQEYGNSHSKSGIMYSSSFRIKHSGCHCTPSIDLYSVLSIASATLSVARAEIRNPGAASFTA